LLITTLHHANEPPSLARVQHSELDRRLEIVIGNFGLEKRVGGHRVVKERVIEFSCPIKIKLILPNDCVLDEKALKERIETAGPQLFIGLCDACPHFQERNRDR